MTPVAPWDTEEVIDEDTQFPGELWGSHEQHEVVNAVVVCMFCYNVLDVDYGLASRGRWEVDDKGAHGLVKDERLFCSRACVRSYEAGEEPPPAPRAVAEFLVDQTKQRADDLALLQAHLHQQAEEEAAIQRREDEIRCS